ncbi:hypothetical protein OAF63_01415 [Saprospiraceae bacterium]|jgi:cell division protein FtsB|nr:hypothetical protein [Saprospiraceae bacterium]
MRSKLSLPLVFTGFTVVLLLGAVVMLSSTVSNLEQDLEITSSDLKIKSGEVIELTDENEKLEHQIAVLQDSIVILNEEIEVLEITLSEKEGLIDELEGRIHRRQVTIESLKKQISKLAQSEKVNWEKIKRLEDEKIALKKQVDDYFAKKDKATTEIKVKKNEVKVIKKEMDEMSMLKDIVGNTNVRFNKIALRKKRNSNDLTNIKKNDKNWKYTSIEFFLEHPNQKMLLGKTFRLKIKDLDNKRTLPLNEDNKKYPESTVGREGEKFVYDGNMIEVLYFNSQKKLSQNYQIQLFLVEGDKAYILKNGKQTIVEGGNVLSTGN